MGLRVPRRFLALTSAALSCALARPPEGALVFRPPAGTRAMWLCGDDPAAEVGNWASLQNVSEIFVYVSPQVLTNGALARLQQLRQRAASPKIPLRARAGDSTSTTY